MLKPVWLGTSRSYRVRVAVQPDSAVLWVDEIQVLQARLPYHVSTEQAGLFTWGYGDVDFRGFSMTDA